MERAFITKNRRRKQRVPKMGQNMKEIKRTVQWVRWKRRKDAMWKLENTTKKFSGPRTHLLTRRTFAQESETRGIESHRGAASSWAEQTRAEPSRKKTRVESKKFAKSMAKDSVAHIFADLADEREEGLLDAEPRFGGGLQVRKSQFVGCRCRCREQTSERESNNYEHSSRVEKCAHALRSQLMWYEYE